MNPNSSTVKIPPWLKRDVKFYTRKIHAWASIIIAVPLLIMASSGVLLLVKQEFHWVQPPTTKGVGKRPEVSLEAILAAARSVPSTGISTWSDVDRLDVRPTKGIVKVQSKNTRVEVQVDLATGKVLQIATRRSDLIESIHDGSWFHERAKLLVFLPTALILIGLWFTGIYLFFLPPLQRAHNRKSAPQPIPGAAVSGNRAKTAPWWRPSLST